MKIAPWIVALSLLALPACTTAFYEGAREFDQEAAERVDKSIDFAEARRCAWPLDWVTRAADRYGNTWLRAYAASCPTMGALVEKLIVYELRRSGMLREPDLSGTSAVPTPDEISP